MKKLYELLLLALLATTVFLYYYVFSMIADSRGINYASIVHLKIDDSIPFFNGFIYAYILQQIVPYFTAYGFYQTDSVEEIRRNVLEFITICVVCQIFYYFFPVNVPLIYRDLLNAAMQAQDRNSLLGLATLWTFEATAPWNAFPSFHIAGGWFCFRVFRRRRPVMKAVFLVYFTLMTISTVTLKMHVLLDLIGGFIVAEGVHRAVDRIDMKYFAWPDRHYRAYIAGVCGTVLALIGVFVLISIYYPFNSAMATVQ